MGLLKVVFGWPVLPVRGFIGLAEILRQEAERELHDPSAVRRQLEEAAEAEAADDLSDDERSRVEYEAVGRLIGQRADVAPADDRNGGKE
jgi:hypothetical protein